jgi:hypothetical protein
MALRERNLRLFLIGYTSSLVGSAMVPVALVFAVLDSGHGTGALGVVLAAQTIPLLLLLLLGGVVGDKVPRKLAMLSADIVRFASEGLLASLLLLGRPPLWSIAALAAVLGGGQAFFNPAMSGLMPQLVSAEYLQDANALRGIASSSAQVVGPALAGVIVGIAGPGIAIAVDSASYIVSACSLWRLRIPSGLATDTSTYLQSLRSGWSEFRSRSWLWLIVTQYSTYNALCFAPFLVLGAVVAKTELGGPGAWGDILAAFGAGSIVAGIVATRVKPHRPLVFGVRSAAALAVPLSLLASTHSLTAVMSGAFVAGVGISIFSVLWQTTLQRSIPADRLARVSSYDWLGSLAFVPVGYALAGPLSSVLGLTATLYLGAGWCVASCLVVSCSRSVRQVRMAPRSLGPSHIEEEGFLSA